MSFADLNAHGKRGAIFARDHYTCQICYVAPAVELDHCWPKSVGGRDTEKNLRASCRACNASKGDTLQVEFLTAENALHSWGHFMAEARSSAKAAASWFNAYRALRAGETASEYIKRDLDLTDADICRELDYLRPKPRLADTPWWIRLLPEVAA